MKEKIEMAWGLNVMQGKRSALYTHGLREIVTPIETERLFSPCLSSGESGMALEKDDMLGCQRREPYCYVVTGAEEDEDGDFPFQTATYLGA